jgi:hypothetical protein
MQGKFILLDNGANEKTPVTLQRLHELAIEYDVDEVFALDVLGDAGETLTQFEAHMDYLAATNDTKSYLLAGIVQGKTRTELTWVIRTYMRMGANTIALPRLLLDTFGRTARVDMLTYIANHAESLNRKLPTVHLLGLNAAHPEELLLVSKYHRWVRSCDSSMAYNYGLRTERIGTSRLPGYKHKIINRPPDYFTKDHAFLVAAQVDVIDRNEEVLLEWAKGNKYAGGIR